MKLKDTTENALRLLVYLAKCRESERKEYISTSEITITTGIGTRKMFYTSKKLKDANLIDSSVGANGGFRLARPSNQITLLDVIEATEGGVDFSFPIKADLPPDEVDHADEFGSKLLLIIQESLGRRFRLATIADFL